MRHLSSSWIVVLGLLAAVASQGRAQDRVLASAGRRPQFWASDRSTDRPVPIDVRQIPILRERISVNFDGVPLKDALTTISRQARLPLFYSKDHVPLDMPVRLRAEHITVAGALSEVLADANVDILLVAGRASLVRRGALAAALRQGAVVGRVTDAKAGLPIKNADVYVEGTRWRTASDSAGRYRLVGIDVGDYTIVARRLGYAKESRKITVRAEHEDTVNLALAPLAVTLDELVTTATGQQRRRDIGNAITTINADSVLQTAPIRSLTDLLENRVPGLTVQHTSGAPGDPARLRLRGIGSVLRGNDPIVIVDGIRIYSAQSDRRSGNLTNLADRTRISYQDTIPAPSPLDQIDPYTIEKIEVIKGPSAATLYGADAANGVIVVTTKRGRPGPTQWEARVTHGLTEMPGRWPDGFYRWGRVAERGSVPQFCAITETACKVDSLVRFQALNDPSLTVLGRGRRNQLSLTASGGNQGLTYSVTGTYSDELGLLTLPAFEAERFRSRVAIEAPDWMKRPHQLKNWSVMSAVRAQLGSNAQVSLTTTLSRMDQLRTELEGQIGVLAGTYVDKVKGLYYTPGAIGSIGQSSSRYLAEYFQRATASSMNVGTGLNAQWNPRPWFNMTSDVGLNLIPREDEVLRPTGYVSSADSGMLIRGSGRSVVSTFNLMGTARRQLPWGFAFVTTVGANLNTQTTMDMVTSSTGLQLGTTSFNGATFITSLEQRTNQSVFGWYIAPSLTGQRLSISTGLRLDGGSAYGTRLTRTGRGGSNLLSLPKLNGSWVISEEPWFPFGSLFSSLRLRTAYGQAQVQPGVTDRLRTYRRTNTIIGSTVGSLVKLNAVGNTELRPERSTEFEGGFEADLLDSRFTLELTAYRKIQVDALMSVQLPPSVNGGTLARVPFGVTAGGSIIQNVGNIRNTGLDLVFGLTPVRTPLLTWNTQLIYNRNTNTLVKLGKGVTPNKQRGWVEGYPIAGRWARPILGYADANDNGVIDRSEIQLGDTLVYMGRSQPDYTTAISTNLALFGGAVGITASFSYEAGATQVDETARANWVLSRALSDPSTSFSQQAAVLAADSSEYGVTQDITTLRFNSFSVNYRAPARVARLLRTQQLTVGLVGGNLGLLHSSYRGKDPDVSTWTPSETIRDTGQLPLPRTWQLAVSLRY